MYARKVVPILLSVGVLYLIVRRHAHGPAGQLEDHHPRSPAGPRGEWEKRVPPLFEKWHQRAHASEAQSPAI